MIREISEGRYIAPLCHDHVGGLLGEALFKFLLKERWIKKEQKDYTITEKGWNELEIFGIDITELRSKKNKIVTVCIERNHGIFHEHAGGYLGTLLANRLFELGWLIENDDKKFEITDKGLNGLQSFGIENKILVE